MAYCKRCVCGHVNIYEKKGLSPLRCTKCNRFIAAVTETVYVEPKDEPEIPQEQPKTPSEPEKKPAVPKPKVFAITLESPEGDFVLPVTGPITVGRNAEGMDYLVNYPDVSRTHFTIEPRSNGISATLTDISSQGTFVNGVRMVKGTCVAVSNSAVLRLATSAILIVRVKEVDSDA